MENRQNHLSKIHKLLFFGRNVAYLLHDSIHYQMEFLSFMLQTICTVEWLSGDC